MGVCSHARRGAQARDRGAVRLLLPLVVVACTNPSVDICDDHTPTETRDLEIGNVDRSVPLGTELPFVPYEDDQVVLKEYGSQAATHLPIYLRAPAREEDGEALRCVLVEYSREGFSSAFPLELERRGEHWVTRLGFQDVGALGEVEVRVRLLDATFEGSAEVEIEAVEPL